MRRALGGLLGSSSDVDDLEQETFCRLWIRRLAALPVDDYEAWLVAIARHLAFRVKRRDDARIDGERAVASEHGNASSLGTRPDVVAESNELAARVEATLERLHELDRSALELRSAGDSMKSIAARLGVSPTQAKRAVERARSNLRRRLGKQWNGGEGSEQ
jgi:RNA polymerase sigma factor (sigma-70 family)